MNNKENITEVNRRSFLGTSFGSLMLMMGGVQILRGQDKPAEQTPERYSGPPINCAVIGCGQWGREIIATLSRIPKAPVVALCDTYAPYLRRAKNSAPQAETYSEYQKLLENKDVQAVIIATPTHLHKDIVIAALQAGKHVYCEAPIAHSVEDARAISQAAIKSPKSYFQSGLQHRSDPEIIYVLNFVRAGAAGRAVQARGQYHKKNSWRRSSPNAEQERALNWRLQKSVSAGLTGESGIHQIDQA
ncbi:MAG: Gfo/Idh/MocA family protein, partial [Verrucomicrobiales bacterium]